MGVWLVYASDSSRGIGMGRGVGWGSVWGRKAVTGPYNTPLNILGIIYDRAPEIGKLERNFR